MESKRAMSTRVIVIIIHLPFGLLLFAYDHNHTEQLTDPPPSTMYIGILTTWEQLESQ
ncbi:hypothetical protein BS17DRAFT_785974 [Gyrodon lividus]|nr:hypothetical protein BS17DRAFT_785974 [Gyrodon lividus]